MGKKILVLNGPNLNRLGLREVEIYGATTLPDLERQLVAYGQAHGLSVTCFQSNHEGEMIDVIHQSAGEDYDAIIINPGAWTHSSIAIRDALLSISIPYIFEVHISNIHRREGFRHKSYISDIATSVICGMGLYGYFAAIDFYNNQTKEKK